MLFRTSLKGMKIGCCNREEQDGVEALWIERSDKAGARGLEFTLSVMLWRYPDALKVPTLIAKGFISKHPLILEWSMLPALRVEWKGLCLRLNFKVQVKDYAATG